MRLLWRIAAPVACVALISAAGFAWHAYKAKAGLWKLAETTRIRAERGDANAERDLGKMYYYGRGVPQDYAKAMGWARKAADQGDARAQYDVGYLYEHGQGVAQDHAEAFRWLRKAADQGETRAERGLGNMYFYANGVPRDYGEALRWYRKAAEQGNPAGQQGVGSMYYHGLGVPQDYIEALRWYRKAADQGNAEAEYAVGYIDYYGQGVPRNRAEAYRWVRKAAGQDDENAQRFLSVRFTDFTKFTLFAQIIGGLMLTFNFLPSNFLMRAESLRDRRNLEVSATGILCVISAGVSWYGYTHYKIRCLACGPNAYTSCKWLLEALMVAALIHIVRFKPEEQHSDVAGEAPSPV